jgi:mRNA interferase HigB
MRGALRRWVKLAECRRGQMCLLPKWEDGRFVRVIAKRTLRLFWDRHASARLPLRDWHARAVRADWASPAAVKSDYPDASILPGNRVVFNIGGNRFRLVARVNYPYRVVYIRFIGTHAAYDQIDASTI